MESPSVEIWGAGLSGQCCALALASQGRPVRLIAAEISEEARIDPAEVRLLDTSAIELAATLGIAVDLKAHAEVIDHSGECWGRTQIQERRQTLWMVSEVDLLSILRSRVDSSDLIEVSDCPGSVPEWTVLAGLNEGRYAGSDPRAVVSAGERRCVSVAVEIGDSAPEYKLYTESCEDGWLQLRRLPESSEHGQLLWTSFAERSSFDDASSLITALGRRLSQSECLRGQLQICGLPQLKMAAPYAPVPVLGRLDQGEYWLGIGRSAAGFDPLMTESVAFELRSALIAAATVGGLASGQLRPESSTRHYEGQIARAFLTHLRACESRYEQAFAGSSAWAQELENSQQARRLITAQVHPLASDSLPYRLEDGDLIAVGQR